MTTAGAPQDQVEMLTRWELSGGRWRVAGRTGRDRVTVVLLSCDGEEMSRLSSTDPALLEFIGDRTTSDD